MDLRQIRPVNLLIGVGVVVLLVGVQANLSLFTSYLPNLRFGTKIPTVPAPRKGLERRPATSTESRPAHPAPTPTQSLSVLQQPTSTPYSPTATLLPPTSEFGDPMGMLPTRVRIPAIDVEAPVVPIGWEVVNIDGPDSQSGPDSQAMWQVPDWHAAGWHETSAKLGVAGNTVLNGHNTTNGEVFRDLYKLEPGALILMDDENGETYTYHVQHVYILPEAGQPMEVRVQNARYIQPTEDERLTLVTCHPYGSLQNRLVVIAFPVPVSE